MLHGLHKQEEISRSTPCGGNHAVDAGFVFYPAHFAHALHQLCGKGFIRFAYRIRGVQTAHAKVYQ
ncbi:Uncharacterised protein [Vibrio cholerae]|nr:Uncharacterised protein [Vibrio cholerae]